MPFSLPLSPSHSVRRLLMLTAFLLPSSFAVASTINWGSLFNDTLLTSSGQPLDTSYSFELGTFKAGFVPSYTNTHLWQENWLVFDRAFDPTPADPNDGDPEGWNVPDQFFVSEAVHTALGESDSPYATAGAVFDFGATGYLWVFNNKDGNEGSEWALVRDDSPVGDTGGDWLFPDPIDPIDPPGTFYDWKLGDADVAIIGGVNGVQGPGLFSANPTTFSLQTHAVPEPGTAWLLALAIAITAQRLRPQPSATTEG